MNQEYIKKVDQMVIKKKYHQKVNEIASFMHAYYNAAMKSKSVNEGDNENQILMAAMLEALYKIPGYPAITDDADNIVTCTPSVSSQPMQLAVVVEGGIVQGIVSDRPECFKGISTCVVDYDVDGSTDTINVKSILDSSVEPAISFMKEVSMAGIDLEDVLQKIGGDDDA